MYGLGFRSTVLLGFVDLYKISHLLMLCVIFGLVKYMLTFDWWYRIPIAVFYFNNFFAPSPHPRDRHTGKSKAWPSYIISMLCGNVEKTWYRVSFSLLHNRNYAEKWRKSHLLIYWMVLVILTVIGADPEIFLIWPIINGKGAKQKNTQKVHQIFFFFFYK